MFSLHCAIRIRKQNLNFFLCLPVVCSKCKTCINVKCTLSAFFVAFCMNATSHRYNRKCKRESRKYIKLYKHLQRNIAQRRRQQQRWKSKETIFLHCTCNFFDSFSGLCNSFELFAGCNNRSIAKWNQLVDTFFSLCLTTTKTTTTTSKKVRTIQLNLNLKHFKIHKRKRIGWDWRK